MYASIFAGLRRGNFPLGDSIRIIGIGMWCNISDGLVQNDSPDNVTTGIGVQIRSQSYNVADAQQQADVFATPIITKIHEFNFMFECDYFIDFSSLQYSLTGFPQPDGTPSGYTRLNLTWNPATSNFATITVDPAFAAKRLIMRPMLLIEHTRTVFPVGF
jgi:hypothetical protein